MRSSINPGRFGFFLSLSLVCGFSEFVLQGGPDWNQFRGSTGQGLAECDLPTEWGEDKGVVWKVAIPGRGWSSPIVHGDLIWMTTATEDGKELSVLTLEKDSGKFVRNEVLFRVAEPQFAHKFNSYASPTPIAEDGKIFITFGSPGTACLDAKTGEVLWQRTDFVCNHFRGAGSSPILYQNLLIMNFDGSDHQYIVALNKDTGVNQWIRNRSIDFQDLDANGLPNSEGDWRKGYATPHVALFDGKPLLLSIGAKAFYAYDPMTGQEFWRLEDREHHSPAMRPTVDDKVIYYTAGFSRGALRAVRPDSHRLEPSERVLWETKRNVSKKPSLILHNGYLFMVDDGGIASCLEASSGKEIWRERIGGNYSASPICSGDRIYFFSEEGKCVVLEAGPKFKVLAENTLEDGFMASPAVDGSELILRTKSHLYRISR